MDDLVRVVTDDLRMRTQPGVGGSSRRLTPLLQRGVVGRVMDGPVDASGYAWYRLRVHDRNGDLPDVGWVAAAGLDGERWLRRVGPACPDGEPALDDLIGGRADVLACFGGTPITLAARLGAYETGPCFELEPEPGVWAGEIRPERFGPCPTLFLVAPDTRLDDRAYGAPALDLVTAADIPDGLLAEDAYRPRTWPLVTVTGMYDHPSARQCRIVNGSGDGPPPDPAAIVLGCRTTFVVTDIVAAR